MWGEISIHVVDPQYMGRKNDWRHFAMMRYACQIYGFTRFVSHVATENKAALLLNKRMGLYEVGLVKDWGRDEEGNMIDGIQFGITRKQLLG